MFNNSGFTMPVVPAGYSTGGNGGFGEEGNWIWILVIFALLFGWGNNGYGGNNGGGNAQFIPYQLGANYTDSAIQRGFDNQAVIQKLDGITQGICDSTYALNNSITNGFAGVNSALCQGFNGVNTAMLQGFNGVERGFCNLSSQLSTCCCDIERGIDGINYNMAKNTCDIQNTMHNNTRDIIDNANANNRALLDFLVNDKIASLQSENQSLKLSASQANQNAVLMAAMDANKAEILRKTGAECPQAAYIVQPPTPVTFPQTCGCNGYSAFGYGNVVVGA